MRKRIVIEVLVGLILIGLLTYSLYFRFGKQGGHARVVALTDAGVQETIKANQRKLLVIGLDGATWQVLLEVINQGRAPHFQALMEKGAHAALHSVPPLISPAIWTSVATGVPRDVHGIDNFVAKIPFQYNVTEMNSRLRKVPALWNILSESGRRAAVVNWNAGYPAEPLRDGVFVGFNTTRDNLDESHVYPADWIPLLKSMDPPRNMTMEKKLKEFDHPVLYKSYDQDRFLCGAALEILRDKHPDVMMIYFQSLDVISHGFWKYRFPMNMEHEFQVRDEERERFRDVLESFYEFADVLVGALLSEAEGYTVIVLSDHGEDATYPPRSIFIQLNNLLEKLGYLAYTGPSCEKIISTMENMHDARLRPEREMDLFDLCQYMESMVAKGADETDLDQWLIKMKRVEPVDTSDQAAVDKRFSQMTDLKDILNKGHARDEINWARTEIFNIEDFHKDVQGLYVNLEGREPEGKVPQKEYQATLGEVSRALSRMVTEKGTRVFDSVEINKDKTMIPVGPYDPPDLLVKFNRDVIGHEKVLRSRTDQDPIPMAALRWAYKDVSADHIPDGVLIIAGEDTEPMANIEAQVMDIMPTMLWYLGLPAAADMPGSPLLSAFSGKIKKEPVRFINTWSDKAKFSVGGEPESLTPERRKTLEGLGYIKK